MNERTDLDRILGSWLRAEAPRTAPDDLIGPVFAVTSASQPLPAWRALLSVPPMRTESVILVGSPVLRMARVLIALVVLASLIAGAAVVGSGLIGPVDRDLALPGGSCQPTLPEGVVAQVDRISSASSATHRMYADGWFATGPPLANIDSAMTARRMTDTGMRLYLDALEDTDLVGACRRVFSGSFGQTVRVRAVADGGLVDTFYEGPDWSGTLRALEAGEAAAAEDLIDRLEHPETWLPSDAWLVPDERPFVPPAFTVLVSFYEYQTEVATPIEGSEPSELILSDGSSLADHGIVRVSGSNEACVVLDRNDALALRMALPEAPQEAIVWRVLGPPRKGPATVAIWSTFDDCTNAGWEPQAGLTVEWPQAPAGPPAASRIGVEPCRLVEPATIASILPGEWGPGLGSISNEALPGGGIRCWFRERGAQYWRSFAITVRSVPTDSAEAAALVADLFGPTQSEAGLMGGELWINGCFAQLCTPAIALASEPYFVLLTLVPDTEYNRDQLRALALEVLRNLRELPKGTNP